MIDTGRFHYNVLFVFCECELHPCTLLRHGFWASSPAAPNIAISTKLLREMTLLMLESDVSAKAFIQMLRWKNAWSECEVSVLTLATYVAKLNYASDFILCYPVFSLPVILPTLSLATGCHRTDFLLCYLPRKAANPAHRPRHG